LWLWENIHLWIPSLVCIYGNTVVYQVFYY
jgi:hypothetical protein